MKQKYPGLADLPPLFRITREELKRINPTLLRVHRRYIEQALQRERFIRPSVVATYPDLAKRVCPCGTILAPWMSSCGNRCSNCWEVERRLRNYLSSRHGQEFVRDLLLELHLIKRGFPISAKE